MELMMNQEVQRTGSEVRSEQVSIRFHARIYHMCYTASPESCAIISKNYTSYYYTTVIKFRMKYFM